MIYQTIGYKKDNSNPTQEHILEATRNALRVPMTQRFHFRIWFPERQKLISKFWDWLRQETYYSMSHELMKNCGHVAVFGYMPARKEIEELKDQIDTPFPRDYFIDKSGKITWWTNSHNSKQPHELIRDYYMLTGTSAYEYGRTLNTLGYFTGFGSCIQQHSQSFYDTFKDAFDGEPFIPIVMVHSGTRAALIQHTNTRNVIDGLDPAGALIELERTPMKQPVHDGYGKIWKNGPYYTTDADNKLQPLTFEQAKEMGVLSSPTK
tara:strand:- start:349 stop:1140 length:792 start_codon:yes stop_codon:yes gene_type:complete